MILPPSTVADSGTKRLPLGSRITYIACPTLDAVADVEVEHHVQRRPGVAAEHFHQGRPLPGGNRGERVREEFPAAEEPRLPVKRAHHVRQALLVESLELRGVRLPLIVNAVDVIQRVPDLMAHDVWRRRRPGADYDLAL